MIFENLKNFLDLIRLIGWRNLKYSSKSLLDNVSELFHRRPCFFGGLSSEPVEKLFGQG
jgi:hypothetical protein